MPLQWCQRPNYLKNKRLLKIWRVIIRKRYKKYSKRRIRYFTLISASMSWWINHYYNSDILFRTISRLLSSQFGDKINGFSIILLRLENIKQLDVFSELHWLLPWFYFSKLLLLERVPLCPTTDYGTCRKLYKPEWKVGNKKIVYCTNVLGTYRGFI